MLENNEKKPKTQTLLPWRNDLIHNAVDQNGAYVYLFKTDVCNFYAKSTVEYQGETFLPKQHGKNGDIPYLAPDIKLLRDLCDEINTKESISLDKIEKTFFEVENFIRSYIEMPNEEDYLILALYIFHTYMVEQSETSPMLYFHGTKESGKSRAGEVLSILAFRGYLASSMTPATTFRIADIYKPTMVVDETNLAGNIDLQNIVKARYKRGIRIPRINDIVKGEDGIGSYEVFGPTVLCTTEMVDDIIESRCLVFRMRKNKNPEVEKSIDKKEAERLRVRLTIIRTNYLGESIPVYEKIERRHLGELIQPLYEIMKLIAPAREEEFMTFVERIKEDNKRMEIETLEAKIVRAISELVESSGYGFIATNHISGILNRHRDR